MSLQHDVKRYDLKPLTQGLDRMVQSTEGHFVTFTDYEAVRGEVERLTAQVKSLDNYWMPTAKNEERLKLLAESDVKRLKAELDIAKKLPRFNEQTHIARMVDAGCVVDFNGEDLYVQNVRAETAEASLRSLRDALELAWEYVSHKSGCASVENTEMFGRVDSCSCGLADVVPIVGDARVDGKPKQIVVKGENHAEN